MPEVFNAFPVVFVMLSHKEEMINEAHRFLKAWMKQLIIMAGISGSKHSDGFSPAGFKTVQQLWQGLAVEISFNSCPVIEVGW
jgi:hypothetical protein